MSANDRVVIAGAGVAGLTIGNLLAENGIPVAILEREERVGGLARSFTYDDCIFDIGPHRFHSDNQEVIRYVKRVMPRDLEEISRSSGVWFFGKYYDWPLGPMTIIRLPRHILLKVFRDLFTLLSPRAHNVSFEDHIVNMFGRTLYTHFFKDYSTKFLRIPPPLTHADWAKTGIDRAIIDERLQMKTLWQLIFSLFRPKPDTRFLYPKYGVGRFCEAQAGIITKLNGDIETGAPVTGVFHEGDRITGILTAGEAAPMPVSHLVWTGSLTLLSKLLGLETPHLDYLSLVIYNVVLKEPPAMSYQWCYFGDYDILFNRVSNPKLFSAATAPGGLHQLCAEVTTMNGHQVWQQPEAFQDQIIDDLCKVKLISSPSQVLAVHIEKIQESYPVYDLEYPQKLSRALENLRRFSNLTLAGRTALFWYNNMDHSIENAFQAAASVRRSLAATNA